MRMLRSVRPLLVALAVSGVAALLLSFAWHAHHVPSSANPFEALLIRGCAGLLAAATVWGWAATITLIFDAARSARSLASPSSPPDGPRLSQGLPLSWRRWILALCGTAIVAAATTPAYAASGHRESLTAESLDVIVAGLPFPDRAVDESTQVTPATATALEAPTADTATPSADPTHHPVATTQPQTQPLAQPPSADDDTVVPGLDPSELAPLISAEQLIAVPVPTDAADPELAAPATTQTTAEPHRAMRATSVNDPRVHSPLRPAVVVVASGDSLWTISARLIQTTDHSAIDRAWRSLYAANLERVGPDPDLIEAGTKLTVPRSLR